MKKKRAKPPAAALWLAVRVGAADCPARLDGVFAGALPLPAARRVSRLRGAPAGVLAFFPAGPLPDLTELLAWLNDLPVTTRTVAYAAPAPEGQQLELARLVDALLVDVYAEDQVAPGMPVAGAEQFAQLYRLLAPQTRVVPKLWVGRADGDLTPDYHLLDELCLAGDARQIRLALHFSATRGPGSPEAVQRFCAETAERFADGAAWGAFTPTTSYAAYLAEMSVTLGWPALAWDRQFSASDRLRAAALLL